MLSTDRINKIKEALNVYEFDERLLDKLFNEDNVNEVIFEEWTPLAYAIDCQHLEAVHYFVELGADLNKVGPEGRTPLVQAVFKNDQQIVDLLLDKNPKIPLYDTMGCPILSVAVNNQMVRLAHILVEELHAKVNELDEDDHTTSLIKAAQSGNLDIVKLLVRNHAKLNHIPVSGVTAIASAAIQGHQAIVMYLLHNGADIMMAKKSIKSRLEEVLDIAADDVEDEIAKLRSGFEMLVKAISLDAGNDVAKSRFSLFNAHPHLYDYIESTAPPKSQKDKKGG